MSQADVDQADVDVVFFDIGQTLATARLTPERRLAALEPLPGVLQDLARLQDAGLRLGIISNTGEETAQTMRRALVEAGLFRFFENEPQLLIYSSEVHLLKDSPEIFRLACRRADREAEPRRCMFVGEDADEREFATAAGLQVSVSPAAAVQALLESPGS
jgi:FMN phosphatase YigB (HAD superfamily)